MESHEMLALMAALDSGTNMFGQLKPDVRARLFAVVDNPTDSTWEDAKSLQINADRFITLWQACMRYTGYTVSTAPSDGPWPLLPTREQLLTAIVRAVS